MLLRPTILELARLVKYIYCGRCRSRHRIQSKKLGEIGEPTTLLRPQSLTFELFTNDAVEKYWQPEKYGENKVANLFGHRWLGCRHPRERQRQKQQIPENHREQPQAKSNGEVSRD